MVRKTALASGRDGEETHFKQVRSGRLPRNHRRGGQQDPVYGILCTCHRPTPSGAAKIPFSSSNCPSLRKSSCITGFNPSL